LPCVNLRGQVKRVIPSQYIWRKLLEWKGMGCLHNVVHRIPGGVLCGLLNLLAVCL
jgi:hypothetical protein